MRLLVVSPFLPYPLTYGGALRVYYLLREAARRHEVHLLCPGVLTPEAAAALNFCRSLHVLRVPASRPVWSHLRFLPAPVPYSMSLVSREMRQAFVDLLAAIPFDLVQIEFLSLAHLARPGGNCRRILVHHFIASELRRRQLGTMPWGARRLYYAFDLVKIRRYERAVLAWFDGHVTVSSRDARIVGRWAPGVPVMAVPNGVDTDYFVPTGEPEDPCSMVFVGSFAFDPANVNAAIYLVREVFPAIRRRLPQATLTVVGRDPPDEVLALSGEGVRVIASPDDVRPYLSRASLVVLPMRSGAGTKVRIAAAMAMGKAILTTPLGSEGLDAVPGEDIEVADSQAFADAAVELLSDPQRRREMGRRARARAVSDLDWRIVGLRLEALYRQVLGENLAPVKVRA